MEPNQNPQRPAGQDPFNNSSPNNGPLPTQPGPATPFAPQPQPEVTQPSFRQPDGPTLPQPSTQPQTAQYQTQQPPQQQAQSQAIQPPTDKAPYVQGQVYSGPGGGQPVQGPSGNSNKKRLLLGGGILAIVVLLGLGGIFGLYLPNKPENVWSAGLLRSGETVDKLVVSATEEKQLEAVQNSEFTGTAEANVAGKIYNGSFNTKYDEKQSDNSITYRGDGQAEDFKLKVLTDLADGQDYPNIFFQIMGLKSLGVDQYMPGLEEYDGKWISVTSEYLKASIPTESTESSEPENESQFTSRDASELARAVSKTTQEYIFTNEPDKAVLVRKSFIGTETIENNISANHYKVGINKENAKKYCRALIENVTSTEAYKHIPGVNTETIEQDKNEAIEGCEKDVNEEVKDSDDFDMWIDKKRKLISKVKFTDTEKSGTYVEIGQTYSSGDVVPLFMKVHSDEDKYEYSMTLDTDMKKNTTKGTLKFDYNDEEKYTFNASFEFKPFDGDVTFDKPADAIPIEELMKAFDVGSPGFEDSDPSLDSQEF